MPPVCGDTADRGSLTSAVVGFSCALLGCARAAMCDQFPLKIVPQGSDDRGFLRILLLETFSPEILLDLDAFGTF